MIQDNLFNYKRFAYLKWALALMLTASLAYILDTPKISANGGTWLGYTLGTVGALLIVWLMWLGVRKRQYANESGNLRGWVSAHIYLGLSLIVIATLHSGFQMGWNIHSLAYILMMATIATGVWGLTFYIRYPKDMTLVLNRNSPEQIVANIEQFDREATKFCKAQAEPLQALVAQSMAQGIFNRRGQLWNGKVAGCKTEHAVTWLQTNMANSDELTLLYRNQVHRLRALNQLRRYYSLRHWLEFWLSVHVPLSFGLLAALVAHVLSVFIYW